MRAVSCRGRAGNSTFKVGKGGQCNGSCGQGLGGWREGVPRAGPCGPGTAWAAEPGERAVGRTRMLKAVVFGGGTWQVPGDPGRGSQGHEDPQSPLSLSPTHQWCPRPASSRDPEGHPSGAGAGAQAGAAKWTGSGGATRYPPLGPSGARPCSRPGERVASPTQGTRKPEAAAPPPGVTSPAPPPRV